MVTVPVPRTWVALETPSATTLNGSTGIRDAMVFLLDPPRIDVYHSVDRTPTTATWTLCIFDTIASSYDMDMPTNTRIRAVTAGRYQVTAKFYFAPNATGARGVNFTANGAGARTALNQVCSDGFDMAVNQTNQALVRTFEWNAAAGDYIEAWIYQSSGGNLNFIGASTGSRLTVRRLSA